MIYSFTKYQETGPTGTTKTLRNTEDNELVILGTVGSKTYVHVPSKVTVPEQPQEINFQEDTITPEVREQLKKQPFTEMKKTLLRSKIEVEVGDIHDLLADCMKLIEFNTMLTTRLAADYFGSVPMDQATKDRYSMKVQTLLENVDNGNVQLRGNYDSVDGMFEKMMERYTYIQTIVKEQYIDLLKEVELEQ